jgi:hypothetical protein
MLLIETMGRFINCRREKTHLSKRKYDPGREKPDLRHKKCHTGQEKINLTNKKLSLSREKCNLRNRRINIRGENYGFSSREINIGQEVYNLNIEKTKLRSGKLIPSEAKFNLIRENYRFTMMKLIFSYQNTNDDNSGSSNDSWKI